MTGYLMLNGRLAGADLISRISGFVPQEDLAIEDLTVDEHMTFMVREYLLLFLLCSAANKRMDHLMVSSRDRPWTNCTLFFCYEVCITWLMYFDLKL